MAENLAAAIAEEKAAVKTYEELIVAKKREAALTATVESKTQEIGDLGASIVTMKQDLSDTQDALAEDQQFSNSLVTV